VDSLLDLHRRLFETQLARNETQVRVAQRLRYLAYCEQRGYLDAACYPERRESDAYDARSVHALMIARTTRRPLGAARLILPPESFPVEKLIAPRLFERLPGFERARTAEISRLCMVRGLPEALGIGSAAMRGWTADDPLRHVLRHAVAGVLRGIVTLSLEHGIERWCAMMSRPMLRRLAHLGIRFDEIGAPIRHFGIKQPVMASVEDVASGMRKQRPDVWELVGRPL
jgi:N-acyl amino acid synthase of PEP-CTERM/exosortase system